MTPAADTLECVPLHTSIQLMRAVLTNAACAVPAAALTDPALADWVRTQGVTVTAHDDNELDLLQYIGIRPVQIIFRCGSATTPIRRAVALGVPRFIVATSQQITHVAEGAKDTKYVYLDEHAPLVLGDRRLKVMGLHSDVENAGVATEWACVVERLLARSAVLKTCGSPIKRIALTGGSTAMWLQDSAHQLTSIVSAVDEALRDGSERWHVTRPAATLSPVTVGNSFDLASPVHNRRRRQRRPFGPYSASA